MPVGRNDQNSKNKCGLECDMNLMTSKKATRKMNPGSLISIVLFLFALFICLLQAERTSYLPPVQIAGEHEFVEGTPAEQILYDGISLTPGIYEICMDYTTDRDYSGHCDVTDESAREGRLLTNGEHFYKGKGRTSFCLWLYDATDTLKISALYEGEGYLKTGALTIRNTGKLWSVAGVILFVCAVVLWGGQRIYAKYRQGRIPSGAWKTAAVLLLITFAASLTQMSGYLLGGADLTYHLQRIEGVKDSLLAGQFPVRIEPEWLYGYGYANGIFYCNALLYLPAFLRLAGFTITTSYNIYCICLNLATACIAWYCFGRIFRDNRIGLMCSALYTLSIIRIYKLAIVGAVGEGSALTFLPLIFYGMYLVFADTGKYLADAGETPARGRAWVYLAFGYAGLMQTHVLTCEITAFLTLLICLVCIRRIFRKNEFFLLLKGAAGAVGLSFYYLVPFLDYYITQDMHIRHVSGRTIQERGLYFAQLFVNTWTESTREWLGTKGMIDVEPVSPGTLCMLTLIMFFILWGIDVLRYFRGAGNASDHIGSKSGSDPADVSIRATVRLSAIFSGMLLVMTLHRFPWNRIQELGPVMASLVSSLQFPNRFLGWAMVFLIMVFGYCVYRFAGKRFTYPVGILLTVLSIVSGSLCLLKDSSDEDHRLYLYNEAGMGFGYISGGEYLVEGTDDLLLTFEGPEAQEGVEISGYSKHYQSVRLNCRNTNNEESYVDLPLLLYKGYRAKSADGSRLFLCAGDNGRVRVLLPAGFTGEARVDFVSPAYWRVSELITLITICVIFSALKCPEMVKKMRILHRQKIDNSR